VRVKAKISHKVSKLQHIIQQLFSTNTPIAIAMPDARFSSELLENIS
jgi:hypothetical protein